MTGRSATEAGRRPPIIAFFGTKGGVGKTTLTNKFADLVALADGNPRVLLIDFDVDARGSTVLRTRGRPIATKTIHDYIAGRTAAVEEIIDVSDTVEVRSDRRRSVAAPSVYIMPSATPDALATFKTVAGLEYPELLSLVTRLIEGAIEKHKIDCVLIDCGPTIDPYTATAAHIADRAFIIGQNEPISFEALREYRAKIRNDYFPDFNSTKMNVILNKVRGLPESQDYFALIPFTIDVVDLSEGLPDVDAVRLTLLDHYVFDIVKRTLGQDWGHLVPDAQVILGDDWLHLLEMAPALSRSPLLRLHPVTGWIWKVALPILATALVARAVGVNDPLFELGPADDPVLTVTVARIGLLAFVVGLVATAHWYFLREPSAYLKGLVLHKEEFLFSELRRRSGRRILERLRNWTARGTAASGDASGC